MSSRPARRSLAEAFTPGQTPRDRAAGLGGLLPPRPERDSPVVVRQAALAAVGDGERSVSAERQDPGPVSGVAPDLTADADLDRVRNVAVYLPVDLLDRLKRTRRSRELTYSELLVEAAAAHLGELEGSFRSPPPPPAAVGMPSRVRRRLPEPGVQVQIRLDGHQLRWLDEQTERLAAPSRTALVAALFDAHLS